jgi:hypothetical protein
VFNAAKILDFAPQRPQSTPEVANQSDYAGEKDAFVLTILLDPLLQGSTSSPGQPEFINPQESALITLH